MCHHNLVWNLITEWLTTVISYTFLGRKQTKFTFIMLTKDGFKCCLPKANFHENCVAHELHVVTEGPPCGLQPPLLLKKNGQVSPQTPLGNVISHSKTGSREH